MRIAIISDIHDNLVNLKKFLFWAKDKKIDKIICCGDLTDSETLKTLANGFKKEIFLVKGNAEVYNEKEIYKYDNIVYKGKYFYFKIEGVKIGMCHEPYLFDKIIEEDRVAMVFCGHTHKPWIEDRGGVKLINPGTLGGMFSRASFAFWDNKNKNLELKILDLI